MKKTKTALAALQKEAAAKGLDKMTDAEVDAEIGAVRKKKKPKRDVCGRCWAIEGLLRDITECPACNCGRGICMAHENALMAWMKP